MNPDDVIDGKYTIIRQLGRGGMGAVYEARHGGTGRRVAVKVIAAKVLRDEPDVVARFQREARAAGAIESQHVVHVLDTGFDGATDRPYLVMEYLEGADLAATIDRLGPLPPDLALRITAQACLGLSRAHAAGIVHRDIKSANAFLARRDEGEIVVKLLDFGIAKARPDPFANTEAVTLTQSGSMLGSPYYMSPEQAEGRKQIDQRTDIWSLGVVLYEALTGATPFAQCETIGKLLFAILSGKPRPVREAAPWVSPETAALVHRALSLDPEGRFQTASEMLATLRALLPAGQALHESQIVGLPADERGVPPPAEPARSSAAFATGGGVEKLERPRAPGRSVWPLAAAGVVLVVAGGFGVRGLVHRVSISQDVAASVSPAMPVPSSAPPIPSAPQQEQLQPAASAEIDRADGGALSLPQQANPPPVAPSSAGRATPTKAPIAAQGGGAASVRPAPTASTPRPPSVYDHIF